MFGKNTLLFEKLTSQSVVLSDLCEVKQAIKTGDDKNIHSRQKIKIKFQTCNWW